MSDYHGRIMNLRCDVPDEVLNGSGSLRIETAASYKIGHRDARHAAAEIAIEADQIREILSRIIASADEPDSRNGVDEDYVIVHARLITEAREVLK